MVNIVHIPSENDESLDLRIDKIKFDFLRPIDASSIFLLTQCFPINSNLSLSPSNKCSSLRLQDKQHGFSHQALVSFIENVSTALFMIYARMR